MEGKGGRRQRRAGWDAGAAARRGRAARLLGQAGLAAGFLYGSAASQIRARQASPRQRSAGPVVATLAPCRATMHGAAKNVSFEN